MLRLIAIALLAVVLAHPAFAQKRHALVIGIDQYQNLAEGQQLRKAVGDARTIHTVLGEIGFDGELIENPNRDQFDSAIDRLEATIKDGDIAFVFFSGHGIEVDNANFLLPSDVRTVDASGRPLSRRTIQAGSIDATRLVSDLKTKGARTVIAVFDACRDSPFDASVTRSVGVSRGLARMQPPQGVFVMFSAGAKQRALDRLGNDDANPNSVFTRLFAPMLKQPGMSLLDIAKSIQPEVKALAASIGEEQLPAYYDEVIGQIVLVAGDRERSADMRLGDAAAMQQFQEERERLAREDGERKRALEEETARVRRSMEEAEKLRKENIAQAERQSRDAEEALLRREAADKAFRQEQERMKRDAEAAEERQRLAVADANRRQAAAEAATAAAAEQQRLAIAEAKRRQKEAAAAAELHQREIAEATRRQREAEAAAKRRQAEAKEATRRQQEAEAAAARRQAEAEAATRRQRESEAVAQQERRERQAEVERKRTEEENSKFVLTVCNNSSSKITIAVSYFLPEIKEWMVEGWFSYESGECTKLKQFQRGNFYFYAQQYIGNVHWSGNDVNLCVPNNYFRRINTKNYECNNNDKLRGFSKIFVDAPTHTINLSGQSNESDEGE